MLLFSNDYDVKLYRDTAGVKLNVIIGRVKMNKLTGGKQKRLFITIFFVDNTVKAGRVFLILRK